MTWLRSTGLDVVAHSVVAAVLTALAWLVPCAVLVAALFYVREWCQEQGKTGNYSITNAWRFRRWSLDKNLEWAVPAAVAIIVDLII